jgi:hypothetical protein
MKALFARRKSSRSVPASRSLLRRALVLPATVVVAVPALATEAQAGHQRTVNGSVAMRIMDHETFGANAVCNRSVDLKPAVVTVGGHVRVKAWAKCGGEIRVEVHYKLTLDPNGVVRVTEGIVKFFEGDSENTGDLDGASAFANMILFPGLSLSRNVHVQNWNEGQPDDTADVRLTVRN